MTDRVERQALCHLDHILPYFWSILKQGLRACGERGTGMGLGMDYSMEYTGVVGGIIMGLVVDINDQIPSDHTFGGIGLQDYISNHKTCLGDGEENMDALRAKMAWMRTSLDCLHEENHVFFQVLNGLLGVSQEIYERVTVLEGTHGHPIEVPDSPLLLHVPPLLGTKLVEILEEDREDERV